MPASEKPDLINSGAFLWSYNPITHFAWIGFVMLIHFNVVNVFLVIIAYVLPDIFWVADLLTTKIYQKIARNEQLPTRSSSQQGTMVKLNLEPRIDFKKSLITYLDDALSFGIENPYQVFCKICRAIDKI